MKKGILIITMIMLTLLAGVSAVNIDPKVEEQLQDNDEVSVIVMLNEDIGQKTLKSIEHVGELEGEKEIAKIQQNKVLNKLNIRTKSKTGTKKEIKSLEAEDVDLELTHKFSITNGFAGKVTKQGLEKLKNDPNVKSVNINGIKHITLTDSIPLINADDTWRVILNGTNLTGLYETICIIDTGIDTDHTAFSGKILDQYCYCSGSCCPGSSSEEANAEDDNGHGTHVAGIAAGNSSSVKGIAPDAKIVAIKVCNAAGTSCGDADIISGIDWCTNNASKYNISAISISIGGGEFSSYCDTGSESGFAAPINTAVGQNISVIIASGNNGYTSAINSPACIKNATAVGSTTKTDSMSSFSNRCSILDLLAPGGTSPNTGSCPDPDRICSAYNNGATITMSGTSMAAPHVSGAVALLQQARKLQDGKTLTVAQIESALNSTGVTIDDTSNSGRTYSRIDVYAAILSLDITAPNVTFITPANNTNTTNKSVIINITATDTLNNIDTCILEWNSSNETITKETNGLNVSCSTNKTIVGSGTFYYRVYANDSQNNIGVSELRQINIENDIPNATNVLIYSTDSLNKTNGTLIGSWTFLDINQDSQKDNETRWYNNSKYLSVLDNLTSISSTNTTKNDIWVFSVRVYDSKNWSLWVNSSNFTITNAAPILSIVKNQTTANETGLINITVNATDLDSDSLTYAINSSLFTQSTNMFTWNTNLSNSGTYNVRVNVTDGTDVDYQNFTITIIDAADFDNDSNPDFNDTDDDNDGLDDDSDYLVGNLSNINSTSTIRLKINGSENVTRTLNGTLQINITDDNNESIVDFNWNFTNSKLVINWTVDYNSSGGYIRIKNIDLSSKGITKTVYINKSNSSFNYVCIADDETTAASSLDSDCTGQTKVQCTGTNGAYTCTDLSSKFKVSGLSHSAVRSIQYTAPSTPGTTSPGGGGGGGGGGSAKTYDLGEVTSSGSSQKIKKDDKIKFVFNSEPHSIRAIKVEDKSATIEVASTPKIIILQEGESKNFNLNSDSYFDLNVTLNAIVNKAANISIIGIHEPIIKLADEPPKEEPKPEETKEVEAAPEVQIQEEKPAEETPSRNIYPMIIVILVAAALIIIGIYLKNKKVKDKISNLLKKIR